MATEAQFTAALRKEVGYTESPPGSNRTKYAALAGHPNGYAWCLTFLNGIARWLGVMLPAGVQETAYTPTAANGFKAAGQWSTTPSVGAYAFFDFPGDSKRRIQHVGAVVGWDERNVTCIEGNTTKGRWGSQDNGGGVFIRTRPRSHVVGYGRPHFSVPVRSARVIVKRGSPEHSLLDRYPLLFPGREIRVVDPDPTKDIYAAGHPNDIGLGVGIWGARANYIGATRYHTLSQALRGEGVL